MSGSLPPVTAETWLPPGTRIDRDNCVLEPIHLAGAVLAGGVLVCARVDDGTVVQASANAPDLFAGPVLGRTVGDLLGTGALPELRRLAGTVAHGRRVHRLPAGRGALPVPVDVSSYCPDPRLVVAELEPVGPGTEEPQELPDAVGGLLQALQGVDTVQQLLDSSVRVMRELTAFDRVWAYRFEPDGHGVIVAESAGPDVPSFLGLHYPADDVPPLARALYLRNRIRVVPDVEALPVALEPVVNPVTGEWLDQADGVLRAVSSMHVEYLRNMGVRASMSVALAVDGRLWGLLSAHDYRGPRRVPPALRTACELLGSVVSLQLVSVADVARARAEVAREQHRTAIVGSVVASATVADGLAASSEALLAVCGAEAAVVRIGEDLRRIGPAPTLDEAQLLLDWLDRQPTEDPAEPVVTAGLPAEDPALAALADRASGLLAVPLSRTQRNWIVWLRPEYVRTVVWGASAAPVVVGEHGQLRLAPRESFELWRQSVEGTSRPWDDGEVQSACRLRAALGTHVVARAEELGRLAMRLIQANEELEALAYAAAHDLKEPLRGIHVYASFLAEDYEQTLDAAGQERLRAILSLSARMSALVDSLLDYARRGHGDLRLEPLDLVGLVGRAEELVAARLQATGGRVVIEETGPPGALRGDPDRVTDVLANLLANALKYRAGAPPVIRVGVRPVGQTAKGPALSPSSTTAAGNALAVYVADNGIGIAPEHHEEVFRIFRRLGDRESSTDLTGSAGVGLAVCRRIVQRHGGVIWVESRPGEGATFYFTLAP